MSWVSRERQTRLNEVFIAEQSNMVKSEETKMALMYGARRHDDGQTHASAEREDRKTSARQR